MGGRGGWSGYPRIPTTMEGTREALADWIASERPYEQYDIYFPDGSPGRTNEEKWLAFKAKLDADALEINRKMAEDHQEVDRSDMFIAFGILSAMILAVLAL